MTPGGTTQGRGPTLLGVTEGLPVNEHQLTHDEDLRLQEKISESKLPYSLGLQQVSGSLGSQREHFCGDGGTRAG